MSNFSQVFVVGDIHGCHILFTQIHKKILDKFNNTSGNKLLIYLGDYIDRGQQTKDVISHIIQLKKKGIKAVFLMGNHEQVMSDFLFNDINNLHYWLNLGADKTFKSYGLEVAGFIKDGFGDHNIAKLRNSFLKTLNEEHISFFNDLNLSYTLGDYFFVHAGVDPKKNLENQTKTDFLWSRSSEFYDKDFKFNKIIVHGHTPEKEVVNFPYRINIDN